MANGNGNGAGSQSAPTYTYRPTKETPPEVFQYIVTTVKKNKKDPTGIPFREFVDGLVAFRMSHGEGSTAPVAEGVPEEGGTVSPIPTISSGGISEKDKREIVEAISKRIQSTSDSVKSYVKSTLGEGLGGIPAAPAEDGTIPPGPVTATISPDELRQIEDSVARKLDTLASAIGKALDSTQGGIRGEVQSAIGTTRGDIVKAIKSGNDELSEKLSNLASRATVPGGNSVHGTTSVPVTLPDDLKRQLIGIAKDIADIKRDYADLLTRQARQPATASSLPSARIEQPTGTTEHVTVKRPKDGDATSIGGTVPMSSVPAARELDEDDGNDYATDVLTFDDSDMRADQADDDDASRQGQQVQAPKSSMTIEDILASLDDATEDIQNVLGDTGGSYPVDASDARAFARRIMGDDDGGGNASARHPDPQPARQADDSAISLDDVYDGIGGTVFPDSGNDTPATDATEEDDGSTDMGNIVENILDDDWGDMLDDIGGEEEEAGQPYAHAPQQPAQGQHDVAGADVPTDSLSIADLDDLDLGDGIATAYGQEEDSAPATTSAPTQSQAHRKLILPDRIRRKEKGSGHYHIDMTVPQAQQPQFLAEEDDDFDL